MYLSSLGIEERHETSGQPKLSFGKRPAEVDDNEQNENFQMKIILEVALNNSTDLYTDEGETEGKPEGEPELKLKVLIWDLLSGLCQKQKMKLNTM